MFVDDKKYLPFALEFKQSFNNLIKGLRKIWSDYDFKTGTGEAFFDHEFTMEEIKELNDKLDKNIQDLLNSICNSFSFPIYKPFMKEFLSYFNKRYIDTRWFYNELDYDADGRIAAPIDMQSIVGDAHQGKLNFIFDKTDLTEKEEIKEMILQKYLEELKKQSEIIINDYNDVIEVLWDDIIFINMKDENNPVFINFDSITSIKFDR